MTINNPLFQEKFFEIIQENVSAQDALVVEELFGAAHLLDPTCTAEFVLHPLSKKQFPVVKAVRASVYFEEVYKKLSKGINPLSGIEKYKWCIEEFIGVDGLRSVSQWIKLYIIAMHTYCDWVRPSVQSGDWLLAMVESEVATDGTHCSDLFLDYIEWLVRDVPKSPDYEAYYVLLAWLLLSSLRCTANKKRFGSVRNYLLANDCSVEEIEVSSQGKGMVNAWRDLYARIPARYGLTNEEFEGIIRPKKGVKVDGRFLLSDLF